MVTHTKAELYEALEFASFQIKTLEWEKQVLHAILDANTDPLATQLQTINYAMGFGV